MYICKAITFYFFFLFYCKKERKKRKNRFLCFRSGRVWEEYHRQTDEDIARGWFQRSVSFVAPL